MSADIGCDAGSRQRFGDESIIRPTLWKMQNRITGRLRLLPADLGESPQFESTVERHDTKR